MGRSEGRGASQTLLEERGPSLARAPDARRSSRLLRINVGCGKTPTAGYQNFDNSPSVKLAYRPLLVRLMRAVGLLNSTQLSYIEYCRTHDIRFADVTLRIPLPSGSVDVVYTSHMVEHLDRREATAFLRESFRVLAPGGVLRVVVPDLGILVQRYVTEGDADELVRGTLMYRERPQGLPARLRAAFVGDREHMWMYDGLSLSRLLSSAGFADVRVVPAGDTGIADPGELDLAERSEQSVYVEGRRP